MSGPSFAALAACATCAVLGAAAACASIPPPMVPDPPEPILSVDAGSTSDAPPRLTPAPSSTVIPEPTSPFAPILSPK